MKPSQPYNKFYLYLYLALVLAVVSLEVVVGTLVFGSPLGSLLVGILLGLLALLPITNALERTSRALDRLAMGQASGIVEPIAGVLGAAAVIFMRPILPYALAFAAGAMIYVVVEELIPEAQLDHKDTHLATIGVMLGFTVMMILDVALG